MEDIKLDAEGEKIFEILVTYGTHTKGAKYRLKQQAVFIQKFYSELSEARELVKDMQFVRVVPA